MSRLGSGTIAASGALRLTSTRLPPSMRMHVDGPGRRAVAALVADDRSRALDVFQIGEGIAHLGGLDAVGLGHRRLDDLGEVVAQRIHDGLRRLAELGLVLLLIGRHRAARRGETGRGKDNALDDLAEREGGRRIDAVAADHRDLHARAAQLADEGGEVRLEGGGDDDVRLRVELLDLGDFGGEVRLAQGIDALAHHGAAQLLEGLGEIERHLGVFDVGRAQQVGVLVALADGVFRLRRALHVVRDGVGEDVAVAGHRQGRRGRAGGDRRQLRRDDQLAPSHAPCWNRRRPA